MKKILFKLLMTAIYILMFNFTYSVFGLKGVIIIGLSLILASLDSKEVEE